MGIFIVDQKVYYIAGSRQELKLTQNSILTFYHKMFQS